jgi:hypothetical protein
MSNTWAAFGTLPDESGENGVQATILRALSYLSERDQAAFRKKFKEQKEDEQQAMHTFRELLVGVFMAQQGYHLRYEPKIDGLTPDWHFQHDEWGAGIADVVNLHVERSIEQQIDGALDQGQTWSGAIPDQSQRLRGRLREKAEKYDNLAAQKSVPYVVFIFGWLNAVVESQQVEQCLLHADGLFTEFPTLSGIYHMRERMDKIHAELRIIGTQVIVIPKENPPILLDKESGYRFDYYANPKAIYPAGWLTSGALPYRFPVCSEPLTSD